MGGHSRNRNRADDNALTMLARSHQRLNENIQLLVSAAKRWKHDRDIEALADARDVAQFLERAAHRHEVDEEQSVFPRLPKTKHLTTITNQLIAEHRRHEALAERLADLVSDQPDPDDLLEVAAQLDRAYAAHITLEDAEIAPVLQQLSAAQLDDIYREMQTRRGR